jgi:chromosome segregation ATPase
MVVIDVKRAAGMAGTRDGTPGRTSPVKINRHSARVSALTAKLENHARRATENARGWAEAREATRTLEREVKKERMRADAATAACQSLRRELGRVQRLNLDATRSARDEIERMSKARKALGEMVKETKQEAQRAREEAREARNQTRLVEEWAKRRDAAAANASARLQRTLKDLSDAHRRIHVITEENVRLRRQVVRDRAELEDAYAEFLDVDWAASNEEPKIVANPVFANNGELAELER